MADVDWSAIRARIAKAEAATNAILSPSVEESDRVLAERAKRLAMRVSHAATEEIELAFFVAGGEAFAVESRAVVTVIGAAEIDALPHAPPVFRGVLNFRGEVLPIIDLRALVADGAPRTLAARTVVVLGFERPEVGILVDEAERVVTVPLAQIDHATQKTLSFVRGVYEGHRLVIDAVALLEDPRLTL